MERSDVPVPIVGITSYKTDAGVVHSLYALELQSTYASQLASESTEKASSCIDIPYLPKREGRQEK